MPCSFRTPCLVQVREVTKDINEMRRYAENLEKVFKVGPSSLRLSLYPAPHGPSAQPKVQTKLVEMVGHDEVPDELVQPSRIYGTCAIAHQQPKPLPNQSAQCSARRRAPAVRPRQTTKAVSHSALLCPVLFGSSLMGYRYLYLFNDILICVDLDALTFWYSGRIDTVASLVGARVYDCSTGNLSTLALSACWNISVRFYFEQMWLFSL